MAVVDWKARALHAWHKRRVLLQRCRMTRSAVRLSGGGMDEDFYPLMDSDIPAERFPPRLEQLGFEGYVRSGVEFILPRSASCQPASF